jgi:hypothetical protein
MLALRRYGNNLPTIRLSLRQCCRERSGIDAAVGTRQWKARAAEPRLRTSSSVTRCPLSSLSTKGGMASPGGRRL